MHWLGYTGLAAHAMDLPQQINLHERKFLELARALAARPRVLLLDEVMSGLNHTEIDAALHLIRDIRDRGTTIIFVEHLMRAVVALSDRVAVLNEGALIAIGTPQETMRDAEVINVYLGKAYAT
jgi:branched-chain amino acid transport system permease protein